MTPTDGLENPALVRDLVEWIAREPRPYETVMEAWRTSCPRLPVWEEAVGHGLLVRVYERGLGAMVYATPEGKAFLRSQGRTVA